MINKLLKELKKYTNNVYYVGGFVRDELLKLNNKDIDIEVFDIDFNTFDKVMCNMGAKLTGKSFGVYKLDDLDVSLPRTETKTGNKHTDFVVSFTNNIKEAQSRRDFTINAIYKNAFTGEYVDNFNGFDDLKNKTLRHTSEKFVEDPLRVLRCIRFVSKLGFVIADETLDLMKTLDLSELSKERIVNEVLKILSEKYVYLALEYMNKLNMFEKLFGLKDFDFNTYLRNVKYVKSNDLRKYFYFLKISSQELHNLGYPNVVTRDLFDFENFNFVQLAKFSSKHKVAFKDVFFLTPKVEEVSKKYGFFDMYYKIKFKVDSSNYKEFDKMLEMELTKHK